MPANNPRSADSGEGQSAFRGIPAVHELVDAAALTVRRRTLPRSLLVDAARRVLAEHRASISVENGHGASASMEELAQRVDEKLHESTRPPLCPVINGTGIIIHTGLGRAPLAEAAVQAMADAARCYTPVELEMDSGDRGKRARIVRGLLCDLTGAESATVVNNNAAALMLALSTIAPGRSVIVSRGELIEIGGSFRLPDVMEAGGAVLKEVGTTNKTRLSDYENAIEELTAAILVVHSSNYRIQGFTEAAPLPELTAMAHRHDLPVIHDIGSGALISMAMSGLGNEPDARTSIDAGADLVLFSGDKLLGGPQSGILVGKRPLIEAIEKNPMMRAMRVDKLVLSALAVTLQLHRDPDLAATSVPVLAMWNTPVEELQSRAQNLVELLRDVTGLEDVEAAPTKAFLGGGALPDQGVDSFGVRFRSTSLSEEELARELRMGATPIVPRVQGGAVWLDLRTVFPEQDDAVVAAIRAVAAG